MTTSSADWVTYEKKSREPIMAPYRNRFVVRLTDKGKVLYLSDMVISKLTRPDHLRLKWSVTGTRIGLCIGTKHDGLKVDYKSSPEINVEKFVKDFNKAHPAHTFNPGAYECLVEVVDAQTVDHYSLVVWDVTDHPAK